MNIYLKRNVFKISRNYLHNYIIVLEKYLEKNVK